MANQLYNWKRFWCPRTSRFDLSDGGYLSDPEVEWNAIQNPDTVPFASIATTPCLALLGEPGIGKSHEMQKQYELAKSQAAEENNAWLQFDLRDFQTDVRLCNKVFESPTFQSWRDGTHHLHLYLDSLDEGLLTITVLATLLLSELKACPVNRLSLRIACRTVVWPDILEEGLKRLWGDEAVKIYELVPLRRVDVQAAAQHYDLDADIFLQEVDRKGVVPLAIKPVTLNFLLNTYHRNRQLPLTRTALYLDGCRLLCEESNPSRIASRRVGKLTADQRLAIAARIAAVTVFANCSGIWIGADRGDVPEEDVTVRTLLSSGKERVEESEFTVSQADIQETLDTGLFSSRGSSRMGWAHQTYAEFLAAHYLQQHQTIQSQIMSLLIHAGDADGKVVPQLHETAAWIAGMIPAVFQEVMRTDPDVLLSSDVATAEEPVRAALVEHLLRFYDEGKLLDRDQAIRGQYGKLAHSGLIEQLRPYICDPTKGEVVRRVAIHIAEACTLHVFQDTLADIALDPSQPLTIRVSAAYAICNYGDEQTKAKFKPLAVGNAGEDTDDELKGCGLLGGCPKKNQQAL
jgi:predicted NACHT family NTPase